MAIVRWDPFGELTQLQDRINRSVDRGRVTAPRSSSLDDRRRWQAINVLDHLLDRRHGDLTLLGPGYMSR